MTNHLVVLTPTATAAEAGGLVVVARTALRRVKRIFTSARSICHESRTSRTLDPALHAS